MILAAGSRVAVRTGVASGPPHRSEQAVLPHSALILSDSVKTIPTAHFDAHVPTRVTPHVSGSESELRGSGKYPVVVCLVRVRHEKEVFDAEYAFLFKVRPQACNGRSVPVDAGQ